MPTVRDLLKIENKNYDHLGPNLRTLLQNQKNLWLLDQELGHKHVGLFALNNGQRDISTAAQKALSDAGVKEFIEHSPIYLITVLNITPQALPIFINPECRALMGVATVSPNDMFNIGIELSALLQDQKARRDLQFCLPDVFQCNARGISLLQNPLCRELLAYRAFAFVKAPAFQNMEEKSFGMLHKFLEGVSAEQQLPKHFSLSNSFGYIWGSVTNASGAGNISEQHDFFSCLMLPMVQADLAFGHVPNFYSEELETYWGKANTLWLTLQRQDQAQMSALVRVNVREFNALTPEEIDRFRTILNDESLVKTVAHIKSPMFLKTFLTQEHFKQVLQPYKAHLAAHPVDFQRLFQRNQLIDSLQGYLERPDKKHSHKIGPVQALLNDLKKGGKANPLNDWLNSIAFSGGELLNCIGRRDTTAFFKEPLLPAYVPMESVITPNETSGAVVASTGQAVPMGRQAFDVELAVVKQNTNVKD